MIAWWHPSALAARRPALDARHGIRRAVEAWFDEAGFVWVETPSLVVSPGMEPHIHAFKTSYAGPHGEAPLEAWLHTSPEFAMKKLLAGGLPRIAQFARVFRNGETTALHQPEFTMLEWYRAGADHRDLEADCIAIVQAAARAAQVAGGDGRNVMLRHSGRSADPFGPWRRLSVAQAFETYAGIDLLATLDDAGAPDRDALALPARALGLHVAEDDSWEDVFHRVLLDRVEPQLGDGVPCILHDYPLPLAALARPKPDDPRLAERFELYACGVELANAFGELTDAKAQRARFVADMDLKEARYGVRHPIDEDFLDALGSMPDAAGIALGFDRLVMLCCGVDDIRDVLWGPSIAG